VRILWVKVGGLWPLDSGGRVRSFNILSELARRHAVTVLTTHDPAERPAELELRLPQCERVTSLPYAAPKWRSARFAATLLRSWFSELPADLLKHRVPALRAEVERTLASGHFDLCVADFLFAVPNVPLDGRAPVVFFPHNVEHMIWKRLCDTDTSLWRRPLLEIEWRKLRRYEARACRRAVLTIAVSVADRERLAANAPGMRDCDVPTGVDTAYFTPNGTAEEPARLVFTGSMDWHPNDDAMRWFIDAVLPRIRAAVPGVSLAIVGRKPGAPLIEASRRAAVDVTGNVDDVREHVARAAVFVVPLRIGGGSRLKILEALAAETPVVSTRVGAEGLQLTADRDLVVTESTEQMVPAILGAIHRPYELQDMAENGRKRVVARYSWDLLAERLDAVWQSAVRQPVRIAA
jgi:glycosyltransferase involved in cell wall biosynthesis